MHLTVTKMVEQLDTLRMSLAVRYEEEDILQIAADGTITNAPKRPSTRQFADGFREED